jgi:hypothetical protein
MGVEDIILLLSLVMQKVETQKACQNLIGQIHKLFTKTNMKQIQVKRPCIQKIKYS